MSKLRVIGDLNGKVDEYISLVKEANKKNIYTLQLGDLGFHNSYDKVLKSISTDMNKVMMGNHDAYSLKPFIKFFEIGDCGWYRINWVEFFFVRGAFSLDYKTRTPGIDWFPEEELEYHTHDSIISMFERQKPKLVITHDCPYSVGGDGILKSDTVLRDLGYNPGTFSTRTQVLLERMFEIHQPDLWIFGHYHKNWEKKYGSTLFRCLAPLSYIDLE